MSVTKIVLHSIPQEKPHVVGIVVKEIGQQICCVYRTLEEVIELRDMLNAVLNNQPQEKVG